MVVAFNKKFSYLTYNNKIGLKMEAKTCFRCGITKPLTEYYKHKQMGDGHLNKCKTCTKGDSRGLWHDKKNDDNWREKEKARAREKYHRLEYRGKHKPTPEQAKEARGKSKAKYPEKYRAKCRSGHIKKVKGCHNHHWSYQEPRWKDIITLTVAEHALLHRNMIYDQEFFMFRDSNGNLLETRQSHLDLLTIAKKKG